MRTQYVIGIKKGKPEIVESGEKCRLKWKDLVGSNCGEYDKIEYFDTVKKAKFAKPVKAKEKSTKPSKVEADKE